ncbi:MAG: hypothetical protein IKK57_13325 [Clostridia bacterium]|nr:hypothetical protein [Clostridia bacterium]
MKKACIRICTLMVLLTLAAGLFPMSASADVVDEVTLNGGTYGAYTAVFYAKASSDWFASDEIDLDITSCYLYYDCNNRYGVGGSKIVPPAVELKISRFNFTTGQWELEQNYDVWYDRSHTIELQQTDVIYRIEVYFWNVKTVAASYIRHGKLDNPHGGDVTNAYWKGNGPYIYATGGHKVKLFDTCPITNTR